MLLQMGERLSIYLFVMVDVYHYMNKKKTYYGLSILIVIHMLFYYSSQIVELWKQVDFLYT